MSFQGGRGRGSRSNLGRSTPNSRRYSTSAAEDNLARSFGFLSLRSQSDQWPHLSSPATARIPPTRAKRPIPETQLSDYVNSIIQSITPSHLEYSVKRKMVSDLEKLVRQVYYDAELNIIGGSGN